MGQLVIRVDDTMMRSIDRLVDRALFDNRSDVVRSALTSLLDVERRAEVGKQIRESYEAQPPTAAELAAAQASGDAMIDAEPWDDLDG